MAESESGEHHLKRTLGPVNLVALGIGAIIGAGLFSLTGIAAAENAGPAVVLSFVVAAIGCAFAGMCYSEFATMIPIAGSAYTYAYATMGELLAWIIGWDLVLEYAVGAATVSVSWSSYVVQAAAHVRHRIAVEPDSLPVGHDAGTHQSAGGDSSSAPISILLIIGISESARVNAVIVVVKVTIVIVVIAVGFCVHQPAELHALHPAEHRQVRRVRHQRRDARGGRDFLRVHRIRRGLDGRAGSQEAAARHAHRHHRLAGRLHHSVCAVRARAHRHGELQDFQGDASPVATVIKLFPYARRCRSTIVIGIIAGYTSVILVMLLGQSRVFFSMSRDGLLPAVFSDIHPKFQTPWRCNLIFMVFVSLFSGFLPISKLGHMTSIGTLLAFVIVCIGIMVMRQDESRSAAALSHAAGAAGADTGHAGLLRDDGVARCRDVDPAGGLAGDRADDLLHVRREE